MILRDVLSALGKNEFRFNRRREPLFACIKLLREKPI